MPRLHQTYIGIGIIIVCVAFGGVQSIDEYGVLIWVTSSIIIGFVVFFAVYSFSIFYLVITATEDKGTIGKTFFKIEDEFFIEETQGTETKTRWKSISGLYKFKNYMLVRINGMRIHIIPRKEFDCYKDFESFCKNIVQYKDNA